MNQGKSTDHEPEYFISLLLVCFLCKMGNNLPKMPSAWLGLDQLANNLLPALECFTGSCLVTEGTGFVWKMVNSWLHNNQQQTWPLQLLPGGPQEKLFNSLRSSGYIFTFPSISKILWYLWVLESVTPSWKDLELSFVVQLPWSYIMREQWTDGFCKILYKSFLSFLEEWQLFFIILTYC